jgi:urease accessory protein
MHDAALLALMRLASPSLPVGGFSHSEGLESAVEAGHVHDEATARGWLRAQLELAIARSDGPVVAAAHAAWSAGDVAAAEALDAWVHSTRESAELRLAASQTGHSLAVWLRQGAQAADARVAALAGLSRDRGGPTWPVAFALAAVLAGAPPRTGGLAHAFAWCENQVQAAVKAVPLGQAAAQRILEHLAAAVPAAVDHALAVAAGHAPRQAFAPHLAILSARHEVQYSRLFRS